MFHCGVFVFLQNGCVVVCVFAVLSYEVKTAARVPTGMLCSGR